MVAVKNLTIYLTSHYQERYRERAGSAPPSGQRAWIEKSLKKNKLRRVAGDEYKIKLLGAPFEVYLVRINSHTWIAKTIIPLAWNERKGNNENDSEKRNPAEVLR